MKQANVWVGTNDLLAIEFQNQPEHTVGCRMLRTEVDRVVSYLPILSAQSVIGSLVEMLHVVRVYRMREGLVRRYDFRSLGGIRIVAWDRCDD